jgi:type II secretory pathway pseudopilin PulG
LEIIIAIVLLAIITSFAIPKFNTITYNSNLSILKSELSLVQNALIEQKSKNILLSNSDEITNLDDAAINKKDEKLFTNIINFSIISTDSNERKVGKWVKISKNSYEYFLLASKTISFSLEDEKIICKSVEEICKEIE